MLGLVNSQLCEGNEMEMFVTCYLAILTISTGELVYANAGHEYPA
ncbi:MAG: SpoIIE family protein phosphatase, partial [Bacteroidaceae bacterium]|nr:SpoIIE family protein phosphatase [Bacteroidaceae bacterium]